MVDTTPNLDDLRFQKDLVDEARKRIIQYCPEWTDYNLSDPGITLIELFAWMTENIVYRLNRVPEKNYQKFLEILGIFPQPATSAVAPLTFYLSAPFPISPGEDISAAIPKGLEVSTTVMDQEEGINFVVDETRAIVPPRLIDVRIRANNYTVNYLDRSSGMAKLGQRLPVFAMRSEDVFVKRRNEESGEEESVKETNFIPGEDDDFVLGFDASQDMAGCVLKLSFECEHGKGSGGGNQEPPWEWAYLRSNNGVETWEVLKVSSYRGEENTTLGLNQTGSLVLHLPHDLSPSQTEQLHSAYWLRCKVKPRDEIRYYRSPVVTGIEAYTLGVKLLARHSRIVLNEMLGVSSGDAGQSFRLQNYPILGLAEGETVEVEERNAEAEENIDFKPWQRVSNFGSSDRYDRHFILNESTGEVQFGPGIRQPDGDIHQYGRVPEVGRRIRISQYRYGGGSEGNVFSGKIRVMRSSVPFVDRVINYEAASGGRDMESLDEMKMRAFREMRSQKRAVTNEDFEILVTQKFGREKIARVKCISAEEPGGGVKVMVIPSRTGAIEAQKLALLSLTDELKTELKAYLDTVRLLATRITISEPAFYGVKVAATIIPERSDQKQVVIERVNRVLKMLLSPLAPEGKDWRAQLSKDLKRVSAEGLLGEWLRDDWQGWPFGRSLYPSDLYPFIQNIRGVQNVSAINLFCTPFTRPQVCKDQETLTQWLNSAERASFIIDESKSEDRARTIVSLDHQVKVP